MLDAPFAARLFLLFAVLGGLAALERAFRGEDAVRGQCLVLLAGAGVCGAAFGALLDAVTVSISPLYFTVGKGLSPKDLVRDAALLGAEAGASAGLLVGAVAAHVETRGGSQIRIRATLRSLSSVPRNAAVVGTLSGAVGLVWLSVPLVFLWPMPTRFAFDQASLVVLCVHVGVYAGTIEAVVRWVRARISPPPGSDDAPVLQ